MEEGCLRVRALDLDELRQTGQLEAVRAAAYARAVEIVAERTARRRTDLRAGDARDLLVVVTTV